MKHRKPLSPHAVQILRLILQSCDRIVDMGKNNGGVRPLGVWSPKASRSGEWLQDKWLPSGDFIHVQGRDSASAIRGLTARGFVTKYSDEIGMEYWRVITPAGREELARIMNPIPEIPKSDKNYPLGEVKKGRLLTWHPRGGGFDCPYCGRENPIDAGRSSSVGFRIAGWSKHIFHCYEQTLLRHGWRIGRYYNSAPFGNKLERLQPKDVRALSKQLKVPLKDIPVKPAEEYAITVSKGGKIGGALGGSRA